MDYLRYVLILEYTATFFKIQLSHVANLSTLQVRHGHQGSSEHPRLVTVVVTTRYRPNWHFCFRERVSRSHGSSPTWSSYFPVCNWTFSEYNELLEDVVLSSVWSILSAIVIENSTEYWLKVNLAIESWFLVHGVAAPYAFWPDRTAYRYCFRSPSSKFFPIWLKAFIIAAICHAIINVETYFDGGCSRQWYWCSYDPPTGDGNWNGKYCLRHTLHNVKMRESVSEARGCAKSIIWMSVRWHSNKRRCLLAGVSS